MLKELKHTLVVFALLTLLTGVAYPGVVWIFAQLVVPSQATGSAVSAGRKESADLTASTMAGNNKNVSSRSRRGRSAMTVGE